MNKYECNICNKIYSGYQSLWNHNKKFHKNDEIGNKDIKNNIYCSYCKKMLSRVDNRKRHEFLCKQKEKYNLTKEFDEFKNSVIDILKTAKIHPKKLQKINKQLINNTTNINNGTIINNTFVKFGREKLDQLLTEKQMYDIVNRCCNSIEESIKTVHFNPNMPEYNNIFITNMRDSTAYIFDGNKFILTSRDEVINELFCNHVDNIELFMEQAKLPDFKYSKITKFLSALNDEEQIFIDGNNNKKYLNYKAYKLNSIKQFVYNNSDPKLLKKLNSIELNAK